ncbi:MAG TPA: alpha/beta hydrolase [Candidatus Omnitrophica bacterium]|nr:alpha/beta hydrolase [Candidatus Omnitrophota bacterium]
MKIILFLITFSIVLFFYLRYFERKSIYFPSSLIEMTPKDFGLEFEDVMLKTRDGVNISAWFIPSKDATVTVLFCHGNGGNISHRLDKIRFFNNLNLNVIIYDYRGYGKSTGSPCEKGLYLDTKAVYDYLRNDKKIGSDKIIVFGESLGSALAVDLISKEKTAGIIIEGGFSSAPDMARHMYPLIPPLIFSVKFNSAAKIKDIKIPKLFFHSKSDEVVPYVLGRKLFDAADNPKEFVNIFGAHNIAFFDSLDLIIPEVKKFLEKVK